MQLIFSPPSPFVRKVHVTLIETGQLDDVELVNVATTPLKTDARAASANPLGRIPALLRPDGPALYDSRVICRFLAARAGADLYPDDILWEILTLEATADGLLDSAVSMVYEHRLRPAEMVYAPWVEAQWGKVSGALDALTERWTSHLKGPHNMGQIAVGCALGYLDFRHTDRDWRKGRDALAAWYADYAQREAMQATMPS